MFKHYITKYEENNQLYAESWLQINIFGKCFCFSRKKIKLDFDAIKQILVYRKDDNELIVSAFDDNGEFKAIVSDDVFFEIITNKEKI